MAGNIESYINLITSAHANKPNFVAVMSTLLQPFADQIQQLQSIKFDIDTSVGQQLDFIGQWVGISRNLEEPLTDVYFALDTAGLGFDQGTWLGPFDPTTQLDALPDDAYRTLLRVRIANNQWDGTVPGAYSFMEAVFPGNTFFIQDNQDMTILEGVAGPVPLTAVTMALLEGGYLSIKPAGVGITYYVFPSVPGPIFGFDLETPVISGFDVGAWATLFTGE